MVSVTPCRSAAACPVLAIYVTIWGTCRWSVRHAAWSRLCRGCIALSTDSASHPTCLALYDVVHTLSARLGKAFKLKISGSRNDAGSACICMCLSSEFRCVSCCFKRVSTYVTHSHMMFFLMSVVRLSSCCFMISMESRGAWLGSGLPRSLQPSGSRW